MSQQGQWQVAGSAPEIYERELVPAVFGPWAPILIGLADPKLGDRIIDIACGTGIVARIAAAKVGASGAVAGVDLNPGMLNVARSVKPVDDAAPAEWLEASADRLPFSDGSFDIAYCQLGLQFFADRPAALREMRRVLSSKGRLAVMVWCGIHESPGFAAFADILERNIGSAAATIMRAPFGLSDAAELSQLVAAAEFRNIKLQRRVGAVEFASAERFVLSYVAGSPLASHVSQASDAARENLTAETKLALEKYVGSRGLSFPIASHLLAATV
ncbi:methyltransferase domain-containing protein [Bradyrhizobium sp. Mp27]|uniref:methyltransferase domain-containing protein n=1 Tax=Bradyrhizobium sp. Mp27 TaxID=3042157 RepID=UPI00248BAF0D|nr:methyltransferase domain-containing protein [Bradyrhizobium sp. Mp27]MDI2077477.1 class I SAM-dependent methyltransferase [Bradyrhizobium sp. Mp27]